VPIFAVTNRIRPMSDTNFFIVNQAAYDVQLNEVVRSISYVSTLAFREESTEDNTFVPQENVTDTGRDRYVWVLQHCVYIPAFCQAGHACSLHADIFLAVTVCRQKPYVLRILGRRAWHTATHNIVHHTKITTWATGFRMFHIYLTTIIICCICKRPTPSISIPLQYRVNCVHIFC